MGFVQSKTQMKKLITFLITTFAALSAFSATLVWDDPNPEGTVARYAIYNRVGTTWVKLAESVDKRWPIVLPPGQYTLAVTAIAEQDGVWTESDKSAPKSFLLPLIVINVRIEQ